MAIDSSCSCECALGRMRVHPVFRERIERLLSEFHKHESSNGDGDEPMADAESGTNAAGAARRTDQRCAYACLYV
jgi:hypothetical protein